MLTWDLEACAGYDTEALGNVKDGFCVESLRTVHVLRETLPEFRCTKATPLQSCPTLYEGQLDKKDYNI